MKPKDRSDLIKKRFPDAKPIPGLDGYWGRPCGEVIGPYGNILKTSLSNVGRVRVIIRGRQYQVSRLIALTFITNPCPEEFTEVDHINGDKLDNSVKNLRWISGPDNRLANELNGGHARANRPVIAINLETGEETYYESQRAAARALPITQDKISVICNGIRKSSKGFTFRYAGADGVCPF